MASLPKYPNIKETDRAYFAGLFDGEGTVGINKGKTLTGYSYSLYVSFGITYKIILLMMQKYFGGNINQQDMEKRKNSKSAKKIIVNPDKLRQTYTYLLSGKDALYFLKVIEPFCDEKKQQASLGIRYEEGKRHDHIRSKRETDRSEFFHQELKRLKKEQPTEDELEDEPDFKDCQQNLFSFIEEV